MEGFKNTSDYRNLEAIKKNEFSLQKKNSKTYYFR